MSPCVVPLCDRTDDSPAHRNAFKHTLWSQEEEEESEVHALVTPNEYKERGGKKQDCHAMEKVLFLGKKNLEGPFAP